VQRAYGIQNMPQRRATRFCPPYESAAPCVFTYSA
jgi:hypothetical protein